MLSLKIAFRYLIAKKSHRAVNVITSVAIVGVAVATMAMVLVLSIFNGFKDLAASQLSSIDPELAIIPANDNIIINGDSLIRDVKKISGVAEAFPVLTARALLDDGHSRLPVFVKGIPEGYDKAYNLQGIMIAGEYARANTIEIPAVQLSVGVANQVEAYPSGTSYLRLIVPRRMARINPANPAAAFRSEDVVFSGVFRVSNPDIDQEYVLAPLEAARDLLDYDTEASVIEVVVAQGASVSSVKRAIQKQLGDDYKVQNRIEQRADSFRMISIEKWVTFMMLIFILVIALFNVISTLSLLAIEKRDNMKTLRSLGATEAMTRRIFIAEGFFVTTFGGAIGIVLGVLVALAQQIFHLVKLSADASTLTIDYYPVHVEVGDIATVAVVVIILAIIISSITRLIIKEKKQL